MASSSIVSSPERNPGARYRLTRTQILHDVQSKFANDENVTTDEFYCQYDPVPTDIRFRFDFRTHEDEEFLVVIIQPVSRETTVTSLRIKLFDDKCKLLHSWESEEPKRYKKMH